MRVGVVVGKTAVGVLVGLGETPRPELRRREIEPGPRDPRTSPRAGDPARRDASPRDAQPDGFTPGGALAVGDGVVFDEGHPEQDEQGGRVASVRPAQRGGAVQGRRPVQRDSVAEGRRSGQRPDLSERRGARVQDPARDGPAHPLAHPLRSGARAASPLPGFVVEVTFERGAVNLPSVAVGATVWKTDDPEVRRRLAQSFSRDVVARRVPLSASVAARVGEMLCVTVRDDSGRETTVSWDQPLQSAQKHPLTEATFREQFGRLGDTPFELGSVAGLEVPSGAMVPKSVLNDLRRRAVDQLVSLRDAPSRRAVVEPDVLETVRGEIGGGLRAEGLHRTAEAAADRSPLPRLHVLARTMEQLRAVLDRSANGAGAAAGPGAAVPVSTVYCEFEDIRQYKDAVALARGAGVPVGLATVRVIKPGEEGLLRQVGACAPDCVLVRNLAGLSFFAAEFPGLPLVADYALNVANEVTAALLASHGVLRMVPSYDLSWTQLAAMLGRFSPAKFEAVVHQHMPMFHMEHCVFCHTLSSGKDHRDCGRPCDHHRVDLRDRAGAANPLVADVGCRNTVYNGVAQSALEYVPRMREAGIRDYRVELLRENADEVHPLIDRYARVVSGAEDGRGAWRQLKVLNQLGVTRGTLED